jgi:tRNA A-37 threonylcarbamoyl transferase component Bud32
MFELPPVGKIGKYRILERIGQGGMSAIYAARKGRSKKVLAIKVLPPAMSMDEGFKKRFEREIEILRALQHPNIIPIQDTGEADGYCFIVMPFFEAGTVKSRMEQGPIGLRESARIIEQISAALAFAHQQGIVHRDVKPSNMLIDDEGRVVLSDFGFAHLRDISLSLTGSAIIGTPAYMSPEQCRGDAVDGRSDQYSLGVVLYEMLTGRLPFDAESPMSIVVKHLNDPVPLPAGISSKVPEEVQDVLLKALAKQPEKRYPTIEEFNAAYQKAIAASLDPSLISWLRRKVLGPVRHLARRVRAGAAGQGPVSRRRRLVLRIGLGLALLLISIVAGLFLTLGPQAFGMGAGNQATVVVLATPTNLLATIQAMATGMAAAPGTALPPGQIETAIAATLTALAPGGEASITATSTPTRPPGVVPPHPTSTPPAPTATPSLPPTLHLGSLVGSASGEPGKDNKWVVTVTISIHDAACGPLGGVTISGEWGAGSPPKGSCTTNALGSCSISKNVDWGISELTFTIASISRAGYTYVPARNHDSLQETIDQPSGP